MTVARTSEVIEALRAAGLVREVGKKLPESLSAITDDSRAVSQGSAFVAIRGNAADGHGFVPAAEAAGASLVIVEDPSAARGPYIAVTDSRAAGAVAAAAMYGNPARSLRLVGVTGTNGKSTTVSLVRDLLDEDGARAASIGTLGVLIGKGGAAHPGGAGLTTPGPIELQRVLRSLVDAGVRTVAMEVSSHSLDQRRVEGIEFAAAVFTNLTRDHLDYHGTIERYLAAKALLAGKVAENGAMIVNADDPAWAALPAGRRRISFGRAGDVRLVAKGRKSLSGTQCEMTVDGKTIAVELPLVGDFNVENAAAAAAVAVAFDVPLGEIAARLSRVAQVAGRLEILARAPTIIRDYAHTPDALERLLAAIRPLCEGRLIVVFGCGGDRDPGKRPAMGKIACERADLPIVTSDNPRTEDPVKIIDDIVAGMSGCSFERMEDRRAAIERAIAVSQSLDAVVIAGKGHETYQIRGTERYPFDEKEIVRAILVTAG